MAFFAVAACVLAAAIWQIVLGPAAPGTRALRPLRAPSCPAIETISAHFLVSVAWKAASSSGEPTNETP